MPIPPWSEGRRPSSRTLDGLRWTLVYASTTAWISVRQNRVVLAPVAGVKLSEKRKLNRWRRSQPRTRLRGERGISRKAIAQGRPGVLRCPVCSCAFCFVQTARETAGAARTRSSLRPLFRWRDNEMQTFGRNASRDRLRIFHCRHPRRRVIQYSRDVHDGIEKPQRTGYPAFAGYDDLYAAMAGAIKLRGPAGSAFHVAPPAGRPLSLPASRHPSAPSPKPRPRDR